MLGTKGKCKKSPTPQKITSTPSKEKEQAKNQKCCRRSFFNQVFSTTTVIYLPESVLLVFENQNHEIFKDLPLGRV
jgi:hypothetical protein